MHAGANSGKMWLEPTQSLSGQSMRHYVPYMSQPQPELLLVLSSSQVAKRETGVTNNKEVHGTFLRAGLCHRRFQNLSLLFLLLITGPFFQIPTHEVTSPRRNCLQLGPPPRPVTPGTCIPLRWLVE
jgi:hypothetical protein